jgi:alkaline phosphatase
MFWRSGCSIPWKRTAKVSRICQAAYEPWLLVMTAKAIALIDRGEPSSLVFLQVEGAQTDKNDHGARPCEQIGETIAFDTVALCRRRSECL